MLPENFPNKELLEAEGYENVGEVSEATDEELMSIKGIAQGNLAKIRELAPYTPSPKETGTGETSAEDLSKQSFATRTSKVSRDRTDESGNELPDGIVKNERGTFTASSTVDHPDMVHPDQVKAERQAALRTAAERIAALTVVE